MAQIKYCGVLPHRIELEETCGQIKDSSRFVLVQQPNEMNWFCLFSLCFHTKSTTTITVITKTEEHFRLGLMYTAGQPGGSSYHCCLWCCRSRVSNSVVSGAQLHSVKSFLSFATERTALCPSYLVSC